MATSLTLYIKQITLIAEGQKTYAEFMAYTVNIMLR